MKKLEDISKKQIFTTPEDYFDKLPSRIQARIESKRKTTEYQVSLIPILKYALPVVVILVAGIFWFNRTPKQIDPESVLASIQTDDLIAYLDDSELTTDEVIQAGNFDADDLNDIEEEVFSLTIDDKDFTDALERDRY